MLRASGRRAVTRRRGILLGVNLLLGVAFLAFILRRFGAGAIESLATGFSPAWLAVFFGLAATALGLLARRWQMLLEGIGEAPPIARLAALRAAGHGLGVLVPSARVGGDPLRVWLVLREGVSGRSALSSVAVDRILEMGAAAPFSIAFALVLIQHEVPDLRSALAVLLVVTGTFALAVFSTARRLAGGKGIVTSFARRSGLAGLPWLRERMGLIADAEASTGVLVRERARLEKCFALGVACNAVVLLEITALLHAFGLPSQPVAVVAALFAAATAQQLPVPAGVGLLEGAEIWIFQMLGHGAEVGLAVAFAMRLRDVVWALPGLAALGLRARAPDVPETDAV